jgi:TolB-like protein/Tfp pilus assembly protein PilF
VGHPAGSRRGIAVLDFANVSGDADVAWLGAGIAETVANDLASFDALQVVDRWRVHDAVRSSGAQPREIAAALGVPLVVTGSYQRHGPTLRIAGRVVEAATQAVLADAKIDGALSDVFTLQDQMAAALARDLGFDPPSVSQGTGRETSNLDAYRAYVEGWLKIESLDADLTRAAVADFERAITLDPRYALALTGLATAELQMYEMTRTETHPQVRALASGIEHARHAVRLDERLADAHATLSFLLVSAGEFVEARAAARRAVALDPGDWRHHYRLGHALWGEARLRELDRALRLYPDFAWARFEMAMVHVARGQLAAAEAIVREGIAIQDRQARAADRFPAIGFHWLLGTLFAQADRHDEACTEFLRERAQASRRRLYGPEYAAASSVGLGMSHLARGRVDEALVALRDALGHVPSLPRAAIALSSVLGRAGRQPEADAAREQGRRARAVVESHRPLEARLLDAADAALHGNADRAFDALAHVLGDEPPNFTGWAIGIDPLLSPLRADARFGAVLERLAARAG